MHHRVICSFPRRLGSQDVRSRPLRVTRLVLLAVLLFVARAFSQDNDDCFMCHEDRDLTGERGGRTISVYVDPERFTSSVHGDLECTLCHMDLDGAELPHDAPLERVDCGMCHDLEQAQHDRSLHGRAIARGDPLAPRCSECHGTHDIVAIDDPDSPVAPLRVPFVCGRCHQEGAEVQRAREIHQDHILENYSESIHGEGLLRKGLIVAPTCASCHTAHNILPHTDQRSSIARSNIAATCAACHVMIENVHRQIIDGKLWEQEVHVLPACVDCHPPHKIRKVFYDRGMADADCLSCHAQPDVRASEDGRSLYVEAGELSVSRHATVSCAQCHVGVTPANRRPCATLSQKVDCSACHPQVVEEFTTSMHGTLLAKNDPNAPTCIECHGTHHTLGKHNPRAPIFPTNVPALCARCHREGEKAAVRYAGPEHEIVEHYTESIHGKGLLKSGLTVTAMCTNCHTAHGELPLTDPRSSVNRNNIPDTCGRCHHGIQEQFQQSIHATMKGKSAKEPPVCIDCHSAHTISRADQNGFMLEIMTKCGRCHEEIATTYFDTYHGKVSQLGYTKTAKCYDCHGAHDIQPVADPRSRLSRENVVATCQKCHPGATRRFAGYLTHATHHDPDKYPFLFWTFWGMAGLLIGTFVVGGVHTLLWIPRALQMRREMINELEEDELGETIGSAAASTARSDEAEE